MIIIRWAQLPEADVASYNVCRSIIGFQAPVVPTSSLVGLTLELKINGGPLLTVTFAGTSPIVDEINAVIAGQGGEAFLSQDTLNFFVRSDIRCGPDGSVEIVGGTALTALGLTPRLIEELTENEFIGNVLAPADPLCPVEFIDPDGVFGDYYALTTIDSLNRESLKSVFRQPIETSGALCIIEGVVVDLQGARVPDVEVQAEIQIPPEATSVVNTITKDTITTITDTSGRFRLAILQGTLVEFKIPALSLSRMITVPCKSFIFINELIEDLNYRYPLQGEGGNESSLGSATLKALCPPEGETPLPPEIVGVEVQDEGITLTTAVKKINFVGGGVNVTEPVEDEVVVSIPGATGGGGNGNFKVEYITVSASDEAAKQVTLLNLPLIPSEVALDIIGGLAQHYSVDFSVGGSVLTWSGLGLDGLISAGDVLRVIYIF